MVSAGSSPARAWKVNSHWLGPYSHSTERSGRPSATMSRADDLEHRLELVEAQLGEILVAVREDRLTRGGVPGWPESSGAMRSVSSLKTWNSTSRPAT